jgi:hypothetical protein
VETLLDRGTESDVAEAEAAIERLAAAPTDEGLRICDIWLLRLLALLARAHGDAAAYADFRDRYRAMATELGFEGHIAWAEAMAYAWHPGRAAHVVLKQTRYERLKTSYRHHQLCSQQRLVEHPIAYPVRTGGRDRRRSDDGHSSVPDVWH